MDNNEIGKFIAHCRKEKGLTQKELGEKLFVTDKAVSKWERGVSLPDITILEKLADELDTDIYSILQIPKKDKSLALEVIEKERVKIKNQFKRKLIVLLIIGVIILGIFVFKMVSFGYSVKHVKYTHYDNKLINLGVPKFSFYMQNSENNYSFKSFRGKAVLENEMKSFLNTLEFLTCNDTVYYYDKSADVTITDYSVRGNILYNTISYSVRNGNYCNLFWIKDYDKKLGGFTSKVMNTDDINIIFIPFVMEDDGSKFQGTLMITDKDDKAIETSMGSFEIKDDELIYYREKFNDKDDTFDIPNKSIFKIKDKQLILKDNYLSKYVSEVILK